jgi:hypothetical protein
MSSIGAHTVAGGLRKLISDSSAVTALTVIVTLIIYTVDVLDYPFDDNVQVRPDVFELVLGSIEESGNR